MNQFPKTASFSSLLRILTSSFLQFYAFFAADGAGPPSTDPGGSLLLCLGLEPSLGFAEAAPSPWPICQAVELAQGAYLCFIQCRQDLVKLLPSALRGYLTWCAFTQPFPV